MLFKIPCKNWANAINFHLINNIVFWALPRLIMNSQPVDEWPVREMQMRDLLFQLRNKWKSMPVFSWAVFQLGPVAESWKCKYEKRRRHISNRDLSISQLGAEVEFCGTAVAPSSFMKWMQEHLLAALGKLSFHYYLFKLNFKLNPWRESSLPCFPPKEIIMGIHLTFI